MGKKRTRQQSSNGVMNEDSSESDGDQNSDKSLTAVKVCQHAGKSIEQNQVKKNIHLEDIENNNFCLICSKQGQSLKGEDVWVCLRCGAKACSLDHSQRHNEIPHSDSHALSLKLSDRTVWCHLCKNEIPASSNKKLKGCVNNVENMYEKYLQGPTPPQKNGAPKMEAINEEEKENKVLEAIPLLPPKIRTPPPYGSPVRGLANLGNTCYFNSVIQCLAQTPNLTKTLKEMEISDKEVNIHLKSDRTLSGTLEKWDALCESLCETLCEVKAGGSTYVPQKLLTLLRKRVPQFRGSDQHDSHELLRHLLDSVRGQDLKRYRRLMLNELGLNGLENTEKVDAEKTKELKLLDREVTDTIMLIPDQVFRGFLVSRLECQECHHSSECVESFLDLSLPVTSEKPQPPSFRRKGCGGSEDKSGTTVMSKHQLKKERKMERKKNRGKHHNQPQPKKTQGPTMGQGESITPISEKGESDVDGDVESEGSDKKFGKGEGASKDTNNVPNDSGSAPDSPKLMRGVKLDLGIDYTKFPLCNGLPDISKLGLSDPSQPELKTIVRDAATIVKEDPMWESRLREDNDLSLEVAEEENKEVKPAESSDDLGRISEEADEQSEEEDVMGSLFDEVNCADSSGECSVQTCLAQFTGIELMTGSNKVGCEQCTTRANKGNKEGKTVYTMSTKQFLIAEAPPVLILHLKRFQVQMSSFRKLNRHVSFPLELDLSPFCKDDLRKKNPKKLVYSLYGIVEHSGTFNGGHYVAYVKVDSGQWFCISDSHVTEVKETRVYQAQAYLLFYKSV